MVMSSNGTARAPNHDGRSITPKTAADVQFASTASHAAASPSPSPRASNEKSGGHKKERQSSGRAKLKSRWSLRSKSSLLRVRQTRPENEDEDVQRRESVRSDTSHGVNEDGKLQTHDETPDRDDGSAISTGVGQSGGSANVHATQSRDLTVASSSKTSSTHSPEPARINDLPVQQDVAPTPELNPAQLVQMALNLSESRRRHASLPAMLLSTPEAPATRHSVIASSPRQHRNPTLETATLREDVHHDSPSSRASNHAYKPSIAFPSSAQEPNVESFSPATLVRAERARKYFELADQHRRLLSILQSNSSARHTSTDEAAEQYNPLRALRKRRARESESSALHISPTTFQDVPTVEEWIDEVEESFKDASGERDQRYAGLPQIANANYVHTNVSSHKRTGTADTVVQRAANDWSITPAELLADTYANIHGMPQAVDHAVAPQPAEAGADVHTTSQRGRGRSGSALEHTDTLRNGHEGVRRRFLPLKAADRLRGARLPRLTRSASASSASSVEAANKALFDPTMDTVNIGPLRRHMNHLIETQEPALPANGAPVSPDHWGMAEAHQYAARQRATSRASPGQRPDLARKGRHGLREPEMPAHDRVQSDPSSGDVSRQASPSKHSMVDRSARHRQHTAESRNTALISSIGTVKHRPNPAKARSNHSVESSAEFDTRANPASTGSNQHDTAVDPTRLSVDSARPNIFRRQRTNDSTPSSFFSRTQSGRDGELSEMHSTVARPRLAGRFVDKMRSEGAKIGDKVRYKDSKHRVPTSDISARNSDVSDAEMVADARPTGKHGPPTTPLERTTSKNRFHIPHLPSFRSAATRDAQTLAPIMSGESGDHISRQQAALRLHNRSPRFQRLAPPPIDSSGQWPNPQTAREGQASPLTDNENESTGKLRTSLDYESDGPSTSDDKLLNNEDTKLTRDNLERHTQKYGSISSRDIARVRALLVASGIKARALTQQLQSPSTEGSTLLTASARACNLDTRIVAQKARINQAPHAARVLCAYLDDSVRATQEKVQAFQSQRLQPLITKQEMLKTRVSEDLAELVHSTSDQADAFNIELSTQATLRTKQVDDAIDGVLRLRRRQFRLLRQALFKLLEWFVLALLWAVWFVVVCFNTLRRAIMGLFRFLRWILTF